MCAIYVGRGPIRQDYDPPRFAWVWTFLAVSIFALVIWIKRNPSNSPQLSRDVGIVTAVSADRKHVTVTFDSMYEFEVLNVNRVSLSTGDSIFKDSKSTTMYRKSSDGGLIEIGAALMR